MDASWLLAVSQISEEEMQGRGFVLGFNHAWVGFSHIKTDVPSLLPRRYEEHTRFPHAWVLARGVQQDCWTYFPSIGELSRVQILLLKANFV